MERIERTVGPVATNVHVLADPRSREAIAIDTAIPSLAWIRDELAAHRRATGRDGMVVTTFDSELFGHWWFEGIDWLSLVLRELGDLATTVAGRLEAQPPRERIALAEGSWGKNNDH